MRYYVNYIGINVLLYNEISINSMFIKQNVRRNLPVLEKMYILPT